MNINIATQLSKMKKIDYRNTLAIASIIEVLIDKGVLTKQDILDKSKQLDKIAFEISSK